MPQDKMNRFRVIQKQSVGYDMAEHWQIEDTVDKLKLVLNGMPGDLQIAVDAMNIAHQASVDRYIMYRFLKATIGQDRLEQMLEDFK